MFSNRGAGVPEYLILSVVVLVIVLLAGYFVFSFVSTTSTNVANSAASNKNLLLSLSDPANVPTGTTALYVTFSAAQVSVSVNGTITVQNLPASGTVNVLSLRNQSIVLAATTVPNGSQVTQIKVNISSAVITVNGQNSSVVIGEGTLTANLSSNNRVGAHSNALVDLIPTITTIQTVDKNVYVLTPAVKLVLAPDDSFSPFQSGTNVSAPQIGERLNFNGSNIPRFLQRESPNVTITSASLSVNGNSTSLSVTVTNHGNSTVELDGLMLRGDKKIFFPVINVTFNVPPLPSGPFVPINGSVIFPNGTIISVENFAPGSFSPPPILLNLSGNSTMISHNSSGILFRVGAGSTIINFNNPPPQNGSGYPPPQNGSGYPPGPTQTPVPSGTEVYMRLPSGFQSPSSTPPPEFQNEAEQMPIGRFIFANGTLGFPQMSVSVPEQNGPSFGSGQSGSPGTQMPPPGSGAPGSINTNISIPTQLPQGYLLLAGQSETFTLSGEIALGPSPTVEGPNGNMVQVSSPFAELIAGDTYELNIFGRDGPLPSYNVTAS